MSKDRHPPRQKPAEGETVPTVVRAPRRVYIGGIKVEVVTAQAGSTPDIISPARRPVVAVDASVPKSTSRVSEIKVPAAHGRSKH